MRRSTIVLLVVLLFALALATSACGADPDDGRAPITTVQGETLENETVVTDEDEDEGEDGEENGEGGAKGKEKGKERGKGHGDSKGDDNPH